MTKPGKFNLVAVAGFLLMVTTLMTQTAAAAELEEIIVTARKTTETLAETPVAVSVLTDEFFDESGFNTITEIVKFVPGYDFSPITTTRAASPSIRGISTFSFSEGFESSVATVIDGVPMGREAQGFFDLYDVERVEVLKGPQGTLFGKNTSAGVINIVTKKPEYEVAMGGDVTVGSRGERRVRGTVTGPIIDNELAYRITGSMHQNDGMLDNELRGEDDINSKDTWSLRGKFLYEPSDQLSALLTLDYTDEDNHCCVATYNQAGTAQDLISGPLGGLFGGNDPLLFQQVPGSVIHLEDALANAGIRPGTSNRKVALFERDVRQESEAKGASLQVDYSLGEATLTSITAWRDWEIDETNDQDILGESDFLNFSGAAATAEQFTQEIRLAGLLNESVSYIAGVFYFDEEQTADGGNSIDIALANPVFGDVLNFRNRAVRSVDTRHISAFGEVTWDLTDRFSLVLGARYTDEKKDAELDYTVFAVNPDFGFNTLGFVGGSISGAQTVDDTDFSGRIIARFALTDEINTYLTWSRGYKGAGIDVTTGVRAGNIAPGDGLPVVEPEIPTLIELGIKGLFLDNTLSINTAFYHQTVEDYQRINANQDNTFTQNLGIDEVESMGFEADISYVTPIEGLTLTAALSYIDVTYEEYVQQPAAEGTNLAFIPEISASFIGSYRFDLGESGWRGFTRLEYSWQDEKNTTGGVIPNPRFDIDSYGLLNLRFGVTSPSEQYSLRLSVENALDEDYVHFVGSSIYGLFDSTTNIQYLGPDRFYRLTLEAKL
ncbi:MAG: TonB-dependent receptor [bacterium]